MLINILYIIWSIFVLLTIFLLFKNIIKTINNTMNREFKYSINFNKDSFNKTNYPLIKVRIKDKYKYFLVDTGANTNIVSSTIMDTLYKNTDQIKVVGNTKILGVGDNSNSNSSPIIEETIHIQGEKFIETFNVISSWEEARLAISDACKIDVVGILGSEFFKKSKWVIDFEQCIIWVKK